MTDPRTRADLPAQIERLVASLADEVRAALERRDPAAAQEAARESWEAIPEPREQWEHYPDVLPRGYADLFVRAGEVEHASAWLRIAMGEQSARIGEDVALDRIAARIHAAAGDRATAELIAGTLLQMHGRRPFRGEDADLLPYALAHQGGPVDEEPGGALPSPEGGAATERPDMDEQIEQLSEAGSAAADDEDWDAAIAAWTAALEVIPAPRGDWTASTWLYTAIGDAHYLAGRTEEALDALQAALTCPDATGSPFMWLRMGQALADRGDVDGAVRGLLSAYMLAGPEILEDEDPRYLALLEAHVDLDAADPGR